MLRSIISLYKKTENDINRSSSGKCRFNLVISFAEQYEKQLNAVPPFPLIKDFISILLEVILKSDINFTDPAKLNMAKLILNESRKEYINIKSGEIIISQIEKAVDILNMQMLKSYFYLEKYDEGLAVLKNMLEQRNTFFGNEEEKPNKQRSGESGQRAGESGKKAETKFPKANLRYALVNPDIYKESKAYEILSEIKSELDRLNSYSEDSINIMLVEQESREAGFSGGTIQNLLCNTERKKLPAEKSVDFENITDCHDSEIDIILKKTELAANGIIKFLSGKDVRINLRRNLRFQNIKGVYKGSSFGFGAALISAFNYFTFSNNRRRYSISNAAAFTGSIDEKGRVLKVSGESIKDKVGAAFFSWVKYCVVPKENFNEAMSVCEELKRAYPTKEIYVIGVENIREVFEHTELVREKILGVYEYTRSHAERHKFASTGSLLALVIISTIFLSKNFLPKDIKPLPNPESDMYLIYAPDGAGRPDGEPGWIFKNTDYYGGDTINFGDVAIGDHWFPLLEFWNNAREKEEFNIFVDGKDKEEFQITYLYKNEQAGAPPVIAPDVSQQIYVKFVPTKSEGKKSAELVFENRETKLRKTLYLKGEAKRYNNGYCLKFEQKDDNLVLEPNTNLVKSGTSVSFWIKPYWRDSSFYSNILQIDNNPLSKNKLQVFCEEYNRLNITVSGNKSNKLFGTENEFRSRLNINDWNFIAFSFGDSTVSFVLNNADTLFYFPKNALRIINDYIYWGLTRPDDKNSLETFNISMKFYIDEFKIYNRNISPKEFIENRYNTDFGKEYLLAGYNFEDATPKRIYDESPYDFWPRLYGGIGREIDTTQPFGKTRLSTASKRNSLQGQAGNTVFSSTNGFARLNKDLFGKKSSFTFQCDVKAEKFGKHAHLNIHPVPYFINRPDLDILFAGFSDTTMIWIKNVYTGGTVLEYYKFEQPTDWNRYTITYEAEKSDMCFYLNGKLIRKFENIFLQDISQNYMGISFGIQNYYGATRFYQSVPYSIDNIRIYNRALSSDELFSGSRNGLLAEWDFENTDKELAYDNAAGLPLMMVNPYELKRDNIDFIR